MKILIVDDDPISVRILINILSKFWECTVAQNAFEAIKEFKLAHYEKKPFDLITLDILMPDMDGPSLLKHIRELEEKIKIPKSRQIKAVMATVSVDSDSIKSSIAAGCHDYIVKPFNREIVTEKIKKIGFSINGDLSGSQEIDDDDELKIIFIKEFGKRINVLQASIGAREIANIRNIAHQLHGTGSAYGFDNVTNVGAKIEEAAKTGDWDTINYGVKTLAEIYQKLKIRFNT